MIRLCTKLKTNLAISRKKSRFEKLVKMIRLCTKFKTNLAISRKKSRFEKLFKMIRSYTKLANSRKKKKIRIYLKVLFSVEDNRFGLHFSVLNVNLVSSKNDGDILTNTN